MVSVRSWLYDAYKEIHLVHLKYLIFDKSKWSEKGLVRNGNSNEWKIYTYIHSILIANQNFTFCGNT